MLRSTYFDGRLTLSGDMTGRGATADIVYAGDRVTVSASDTPEQPEAERDYVQTLTEISAARLEGAGMRLAYLNDTGLARVTGTDEADAIHSTSTSYINVWTGGGDDVVQTDAVYGTYDLGRGSDELILSGHGKVDGGAGFDVVWFAGDRADYRIEEVEEGVFHVIETGPPTGYGPAYLELRNVEHLRFGDGLLADFTLEGRSLEAAMEGSDVVQEETYDPFFDTFEMADQSGGDGLGRIDDLGRTVPKDAGGSEGSKDLLLLDVGPLSVEMPMPTDDFLF